jgi:hypothetical protein
MKSILGGICVGLWITVCLTGYQSGLSLHFWILLLSATNLTTFSVTRINVSS